MSDSIGVVWNATVFACVATPVVLLLFFYVFWRRKCKTKPCLSEIDILNAIKDAKIFPVEQTNGWILHDYVIGQQLWRHDIRFKQLGHHPLTAFACCSKVKGSSQMVLNILKDIQKHKHWTLKPRPRSVLKQDTMAEGIKNSGQQTTPSGCHDIIGIEADVDSSKFYLFRLMNRLLAQFKPAIKVAMIQRFWHREENGCCWLLECHSESSNWSFCLMQPIEGWFETDRCMLTCLSCFGKSQRKVQCEDLAVKLCTIRDYLQCRRIQCVPLVRLSLNYYNDSASLDGNSIVLVEADKLKPNKESKSVAKDSLQEISLLQKFRNMIEFKKESYEIGKRHKSLVAFVGQNQKPETSSSTYSSIQNPLDLFRKLAPSKGLEQLRGKTEQEETELSTEKSISERPDDNDAEKEIKYEGKKTDGKMNTLRKRIPPLNEIGRMKTLEKEVDACRELEMSSDQKNNLRKNMGSSEEGQESSNFSNLELSTEQEKIEVIENRLKQMTEVTALALVTEKCKVSTLNITSSPEDQAKSSGGWTYCGLEKDTVILQKAAEENLHFQSYLGKGMVPHPPDMAFETLRKPQNRKFYDEILKKAEILHDFYCGMKIVYMYYELHQMSEKRYYDVCLLQGEKTEGKKYIITLQSVEWPKCKELENVTRVKVVSSGWIIEPIVKGKDVSSMITYISQMDLGPGQRSLDMNNLAAKQPLCIISLRQHLMKMKDSYKEQQKQLY